MPDENKNPAWTDQTPQNNQAVATQPWDDFVLDFWDLWDDNAPVAEEIQVDSSLAEEEKTDNELGFDIDLTLDNKDTAEDTEEWVSVETENKDSTVSVDNPEWEETINDFDISMDYEWTTEEMVPESEEVVSEEETAPEAEEIVPDGEISLDMSKDEPLKFMDDNTENYNQSTEWHLFHQVNEDYQDEMVFDTSNQNSISEATQASENSADKLSFMSESTKDIAAWEEDWKIAFGPSDESNSIEWSAILDTESEEQKQPEIWDLLWNSPIDLSIELNDVQDNQESNLWDMKVSEEAAPESEEVVWEEEDFSKDVTSEPTSQEVQIEPNTQVENNEFLLDAPQVGWETQNIQQNMQSEAEENDVEPQSQAQEQSQSDERSEMVNNVVSEISKKDNSTPDINVTAPVELSNVSSDQRESVPAESGNQVQSTLSLDQILDSELLSNPQYADNSKASPQNIPASWWGKSKVWLFVGVGLAALACCAAFLAFPSISWDRKPGDTVNTWNIVEYPDWGEELHPSAPYEPTTWEYPDLPENSDVSWWQWSVQTVSFPDEWNEQWDIDGGDTEPVPYVWGDYWESDEPGIQEPITEEIDANQILNSIFSFKSQAEKYYSYGQESSDKQLMKYALRLINLCDNYSAQVNKGEGIDAENYSSFRSNANKLINKITTYMGWEDEVQIIEATIGGEYDFEWKDVIKEYLYNNR